MDTLAFLKFVLPDDGFYIVTQITNGFPKNHVFDRVGDMAAHISNATENAPDTEVFFALGSFKERETVDVEGKRHQRTHANVKALKSFWLDLDVGISDGAKKYPTQIDAITALIGFARDTKLPCPTIVSSGYGIHAYWITSQSILPAYWESAAHNLKALCEGWGLLVDHSRTTDHASILRPVGTKNRKKKPGIVEFPTVTVAHQGEVHEQNTLMQCFERAVKTLGYDAPTSKRMNGHAVNPAGLTVPTEYLPSSAHLIADRCNQIKSFKDTKGNLSEPIWYKGLQLLHFTVEGDEIVHEWSSGHPGYSREETDKKIIQIAKMGPTLCSSFESVNAPGCKHCPHRGSITSPIQIGVTIDKAASAPIVVNGMLGGVELPEVPHGFIRGGPNTPGVWYVGDGSGPPLHVYAYDFYPVEMIHDAADKFEVIRIEHHSPQHGCRSAEIPSSVFGNAANLDAMLRSKGIHTLNAKYAKEYMNGYLQKLKASIPDTTLNTKMGWVNGSSFILGEKIFTPGGNRKAGLSRVVGAEVIAALAPTGSLDKWTDAMKRFDRPQLEAHFFSALIGFGAPLMKLTGHGGVVASMIGASNSGKTLSAKAAITVYGNYEGLAAYHNDTLNAKMNRMGVLNSIPIYVDEMTNVDPKVLSEIAYQTSQGAGRGRLKADASMQERSTWSTIVMLSSNSSMFGKISQIKSNAEAEQVRMFEYTVFRYPWFEREMGDLHEVLRNNYGLAGPVYIDWLTKNKDEAERILKQCADIIRQDANIEGRERFWIAAASCVLAGFLIAINLKLLKTDNLTDSWGRLLGWVHNNLSRMRGEVNAMKITEVSALGHFINERQNGILTCQAMMIGKQVKGVTPVRKPTTALVARIDRAEMVMWVSEIALRKFFGESQIDMAWVKAGLKAKKILTLSGSHNLGFGVDEFGSSTVPCWQIDLKHKELENIIAEELVG